jgi:tetratricopeptide (TPR) repeat protein
MSYRFFRRVRIAPGLTVNLSKSGPSLSVGGRGGHVTFGGARGRRTTVGLPGTGLYWTTVHRQGRPQGRGSALQSGVVRGQPVPAAPPGSLPVIMESPSARQKLTLSFFRRLVTPADEQAFVDGCRALVDGDHVAALVHLRAATHLADGAFMAGCLALQASSFEEAVTDLETAVGASDQLGQTADRYGIVATLVLHITDEISASLEPNLEGALLGLVEAYQRLGRTPDALAALRRLQALAPDDPVVRLSLAELLVHGQPAERTALEEAAHLGENVPNDSAIHAALRLYRAMAMRGLGLPDAATALLSETLRRTADRPAELLHALRYERALAFEAAGQTKRARVDLERLYAEAPDYEDVARRLGMGM